MKIESIDIKSQGYVHCHSRLYTSHGNLPYNMNRSLSVGANILKGEIDSGEWELSYLLSMYCHRPRDFVLTAPTEVYINGTATTLEELSRYTCYIDELYPLFSGRNPICKQVAKGIRRSGLNCTPQDIMNMFCLDEFRFTRPFSGAGNEVYRAMAAVGYCYGKQVFCFPWMSRQKLEATHLHIPVLIDILSELNMITVLPQGG